MFLLDSLCESHQSVDHDWLKISWSNTNILNPQETKQETKNKLKQIYQFNAFAISEFYYFHV